MNASQLFNTLAGTKLSLDKKSLLRWTTGEIQRRVLKFFEEGYSRLQDDSLLAYRGFIGRDVCPA